MQAETGETLFEKNPSDFLRGISLLADDVLLPNGPSSGCYYINGVEIKKGTGFLESFPRVRASCYWKHSGELY